MKNMQNSTGILDSIKCQ